MSRILVLVFTLLGIGCAHHSRSHDKEHAHHEGGGCKSGCKDKVAGRCEHDMMAKPMQAAAQVLPLGKSKVKGSVLFSGVEGGVKVVVSLTGLKANQKQGFHIHEFGNCSSADGSSAGGHLNPGLQPHADMTDAQRHLGDLGNLQADAKGNAQTDITLSKAGVHELLGRAVVVHAKEDDLKTQPSGASGDRVACGVIGLTQ